LPAAIMKVQINPGLSLSLDDKRGAGQTVYRHRRAKAPQLTLSTATAEVAREATWARTSRFLQKNSLKVSSALAGEHCLSVRKSAWTPPRET
jgi:hypothetical protein